jgi:Fe-S oxidoreductase
MATATIKGSFLAAARRFTENLYHCSRCNYCVEASWEEKGLRHVCPTLLHHSPALSYSGKGYLATARALVDGEELSAATVADRLFACTTCGNCEEACPIGLQPAQLVKAMRADLVEHGFAPDGALELAANIAATGNPGGLPAAERYAWAGKLQADSGTAAEFLYLPGCAACYGKPAEARATVALLSAAGVRVAMLASDRDRCCGAPLFETGQLAAGRRQAVELLEAIRNSGAPAVLTSGAECLESLRCHYPQYLQAAGRVAAMHPLELLADRIATGGLKLAAREDSPPPATVAMLDSCHLSKKGHGGLAETGYPRLARTILAALGCRIVPDESAARFAICCGAAGGMAQIHPDSARRMALGKLEALREFGGGAIVSASPLCAAHLERSRDGGATAVYGLCEFIMAHFEVRG